MTLTQAGLCEGYGGLTLAVQDVFGAELRWYAEVDPAAITMQEHHHPGLTNHGDITTTDWTDVEPVDILTGGWPCQPFSLAGKRKGALDERAIWPHVARAVRALRPRLVFLENVASIAPAGELARAAGDLASLGYVGSFRRVRASDVGAPHQRARIFILARPAASDTEDIGHERGRAARRRRAGSAHGGHSAAPTDRGEVRKQPVALAGRGGPAVSRRTGEAIPDAPSNGWGEGRPEPAWLVRGSDAAQRGDGADELCEHCGHGVWLHDHGGFCAGDCPTGCYWGDLDAQREAAAYTDEPRRGSRSGLGGPAGTATVGDGSPADPDPAGIGRWTERRDDGVRAAGLEPGDQPDWAGYAPAIHRWEHVTGRRAPAPTVLGKRGGRQLSARFTEWLMGLPDGWVTDVPGLSRNEQLKLCGNGVVPQQAVHALRLMLAADTAGVAA